MDFLTEKWSAIRPRLIERACGGWLAISPADAGLRIGVTAQTEQEARDKFMEMFVEWKRSIEVDSTGDGELGHSVPV